APTFRMRVSNYEPVHTSEETLNAFNAGILPIKITVWGRGKQAVKARCVSAITSHHLVGTDYVTQALRHLGTIFDYHALREEALDRFIVVHQAHITHDLGPEARIDQVQDSVFDPSNVLIDSPFSEPVLCSLRVERSLIVARVRVAVEVPRRIDEGIHCVGLAASRATALWTRGV